MMEAMIASTGAWCPIRPISGTIMSSVPTNADPPIRIGVICSVCQRWRTTSRTKETHLSQEVREEVHLLTRSEDVVVEQQSEQARRHRDTGEEG